MFFGEQNAFEVFWKTGKVEDYLHYLDARGQDVTAQAPTGEQCAYLNRGDCAAGKTD